MPEQEKKRLDNLKKYLSDKHYNFRAARRRELNEILKDESPRDIVYIVWNSGDAFSYEDDYLVYFEAPCAGVTQLLSFKTLEECINWVGVSMEVIDNYA